jgi:UDP-N-acetylglucosamine 2-epimerase (non-hydrolysing)
MSKRKIKILTIFGTRKELIKLYPVLDRLNADENFESIVVTTSQLQEDLDDLCTLFKVKPAHDLNLKRSKKQLSDITNLALSGLDPLLKHHRPDLVLVQGESTSAFAGALAAFYNKIPVGHVDAGVRTFNKMKPYPEEVNRRLVSTLSELHFTTAAQNAEYLLHEGAVPRNVFITGNIIIDSVKSVAHKTKNMLTRYIRPDDLNGYKMILVTSHKKENWGKPLIELCLALVDLTQAYPDIQIAFPLKFNAAVRDTVYKVLKKKERIHLLDQLPYQAFVEAVARSHLMITDSVCIMEEGVALRKPVVLFEEKTGKTESYIMGGVKPIEMKRATIVVETSRLIEDPNAAKNLIGEFSLPGDGHAAERIVQAIRCHFGLGERPKDYSPKVTADKPAKSAMIKRDLNTHVQNNAQHQASGVRQITCSS